MKRVIKIYVEGKGEVQFFRHFLFAQFGINLILETRGQQQACGSFGNLEITVQDYDGGKTNGGIDMTKIQQLLKEIRHNGDLGIESVVIIDADTEAHTKARGTNPKGGFNNRKTFLDLESSKVPFAYFIVPNGADDGNLEDVKANCISDHGRPFFACILRYITDIRSIHPERMPPKLGNLSESDWKKHHISWYEFNMISERKAKDDGSHYLEDRIWNLKSDFLLPIKQFFEAQFGITNSESSNF